MIRNANFRRKVIYMSAIAALLFPLYQVGAPSSMQENQTQEGRMQEFEIAGGGVLAQMRQEHGLAASSLGDIDPASETMKLATLGMRGVATCILAQRVNYFFKVEDWDNVKVTLNQAAKLQPHVISFWEFQGWNVAFNISVQFDDYRDRSHWIKKGIDFLIEGSQYNRQEPRLLSRVAWFFEQKIGRSDEKRQFRRLFREDELYHKTLPIQVDLARDYRGKVDNWLVAKLFHLKAQRLVENEGVPLRGKRPLLFHADTPMAQMKYAVAIEEEGYRDEESQEAWKDAAQKAWKKAGDEWDAYGSRDLPTIGGYNIRLSDLESLLAEAKQLEAALEALAPNAREQIRAERMKNKLSESEREALDTPNESRTAKQYRLAADAEEKLKVQPKDIAKRVAQDKQAEANKLLARLLAAGKLSQTIQRHRGVVNFEYWRARCAAEQTLHAVDARDYVYQAEQLFEDARLQEARQAYELAWDQWSIVFTEFPILEEAVSAAELLDNINRYRVVLGQLDLPFPEDFKLQGVLDQHDWDRPPAAAGPKTGSKKNKPRIGQSTDSKPDDDDGQSD